MLNLLRSVLPAARGAFVTSLVVLALGFLGPTAAAQTPDAQVLSTIEMLFDGMRSGDSTIVRSAFVDGALMGRPVRTENGDVRFAPRSVDGFVEAVGRPHEQMWDERIGDVRIVTDGDLASAWMEYAFYLGDKLHHCGVNSMQLVKIGSVWKIATLFDTNRGTDCMTESYDSD